MLFVTGVLSGCSKPAATSAAKPSAEGAAYRLSAEPENARGVKELRDAAKSDDEVTLVGRIGGEESPWVDGQAAFLIVDTILKPCNEKDDDACATPWDYCCDSDLLPTHKALVKIVDKDGKTVATDARKLLGVKESQTVVVRGTAQRDDAGNLTVLAAGVFVK
ncbi:MAG TPA: hypothetical protein VL096_05405 [Pirellulaceae bacterium]|nr:hypothetical protein [Pirellulaceae bacterium]